MGTLLSDEKRIQYGLLLLLCVQVKQKTKSLFSELICNSMKWNDVRETIKPYL